MAEEGIITAAGIMGEPIMEIAIVAPAIIADTITETTITGTALRRATGPAIPGLQTTTVLGIMGRRISSRTTRDQILRMDRRR